MLFVQFIRCPIPSAYSSSLSEYPIVFGIVTSGSYGAIPFADDNFDIYPTGFRILFKGSGNWNGSGYAISNNGYLYDTFDSYPTGSFYGFYTRLSSGIDISGYNTYIGLTSGVLLNYSNTGYISNGTLYDTFSEYPTGYVSGASLVSGEWSALFLAYSGYLNTNFFIPFATNYSSGLSIGNLFYTGTPPFPIPFADAGIYSGFFGAFSSFNVRLSGISQPSTGYTFFSYTGYVNTQYIVNTGWNIMATGHYYNVIVSGQNINELIISSGISGSSYVEYITGITSVTSSGYIYFNHTGYFNTQYIYNIGWNNLPTGYYYNSNIIGKNAVSTIYYTGYTGSAYYNESASFISSLSNSVGYIFTTGLRHPEVAIFSIFDNFANYSTGFLSGYNLNTALLNTGISSTITGNAQRAGLVTYVESFIYPVNTVISQFNSGVIFYDNYPYRFETLNYNGKAGTL